MTEYSQKTIQDLKPDWYLQLSKTEKLKEQDRLRQERSEMWDNKPTPIKSGTKIEAKESVKSITKGCRYTVLNHFCTLVTTIYYSEWKQFVTLKNNYGYSVKMNINKFIV